MAHKIALDLNNHQRTYMLRAAGVARFAYNWALEQWGIQYRAWREDDTLPKPSQFSLRKQLNEIKKESFPWMLEVTKCAPQLAIIQLGEAFKNFFAHRAAYPKFRRACTTGSASPMTSSPFRENAYGSPSLGGSGCVRLCDFQESSYRPLFPAWPTDGS